EQIAELGMIEEAFQLTLDRVAQKAQSGNPGSESSILKVVATELKQRRYELGQAIGGLQSLGWEGPGFDVDDLAFTREWLRSRANTIEGGSSEIQRNIIAKQVLGLPEVKGDGGTSDAPTDSERGAAHARRDGAQARRGEGEGRAHPRAAEARSSHRLLARALRRDGRARLHGPLHSRGLRRHGPRPLRSRADP